MMSDLTLQLAELNKNLNTLREREAKYAGNAPLELLNEIDDHLTAIKLFRQAISGQLNEEELRERLAPLNLDLERDSIVTGDITGSVIAMGKGAQVIINQAKSALDQARQQDAYEKSLLCEAVARIAQNLQSLVSPFAEQSITDTTSTVIKRNTLIVKGKLADSPYKALLDYKIPDAPLFYGRRTATRELMDHLNPNALIVLHAEAGAGKSSLLQAGLASRLLVRGHLPLLIRPWKQDPVMAIKQAFIPDLTRTPGLAEAPLPAFLHQVSEILGAEANLYIFLDQFEEFFTQLPPERREHFISELGNSLDDESLSVRWLLALRDEYFGQLATFSPRIRYPFENQYLLRPLSYQEAKEVIVEPAALAHITYEEALVPQILIDLTPEHGLLSPPELQLVCSALFENLQPDQKVITMTTYNQLGGTVGILRNHLHDVLNRQFSPTERPVATRILESMVTSEKQPLLRTHSELVAISQTDDATLIQLLQRLIDSRLIQVNDDETTEVDIVYELAHDYLLTEIEIDPQTQALKAAQEFLARELQSYKRYGALLTGREFEIIKSQRDFLTWDEESEELWRLSLAAHNRRLYGRIALGALIFIMVLLFGIVAFIQRNQARETRRIAVARGLAAEALNLLDSNTEQSLLLALTAVQQASIVPAQDTLRQVLLQVRPSEVLSSQSAAVFCAAWSPDGKRVALGLENGDIQIWNTETRTVLTLLTGHTAAVRRLAFSPSGEQLASASASVSALDFFAPNDGARGEAIVWDVALGQPLFTLTGHKQGVFSLDWSPAGDQLVTASADTTLKLWDAQTGEEQATLTDHLGKVRDVDWRSDGRKLASVGDEGEVLIWNPETRALERRLIGHQQEVFGVAWPPTGELLATAARDGTVRIWDTSSGHILDMLVGHNSFVRSVMWHPDGRYLVSSAFGNNRIIVWDTDKGQAILKLIGHTDWIRQAAWDSAGARLVSASDDQTARLWQMDVTPSVVVLEGHADDPNQVAWHPTERLLASAGKDSAVRLWQPDTGQTLAIFAGHTDNVWSVTWNPNGTQLATTSSDATVRVWDLPDVDPNGPVVTIDKSALTLTGHQTIVYDTAWSPDSQTLATAGGDKTIQLWDGANGTHKLTMVGHEGDVLEIDFSPEGTKLASASADNNVILWDVTTGQKLNTFRGHTNFVWDVEFDPKGSLLASVSGDATLRIWDLASGEATVIENERPLTGVAWNHSGDQIAYTSDDGAVRLWDLNSKQLAGTLTGHEGGVWNVAWSPDDSRLATAAADDLVHIFCTDFNEILTIAQKYKERDLTPAEIEQFVGREY